MSDDAEYSESGVRIYRYGAREKPFQIAEGDAEALEAIEDHIEKHIGKLETVMHELASDLVHIDVHIVEPTADRNFYTLITSGMSDLPMTVPERAEEFKFAELLICLPANWHMPKVNDALTMEFKLKHGMEQLYDRFDQAGINELWDINRKNICRKRFGFF